MDTSGRALVDHWKWAADKGLMNQNTAGGLRAACSQVLSVLDGWETLDVSALNADDVHRRFMNLRGKDFTPTSLAAYKRRFNQALTEFLAYTKNPDQWKPNTQERPKRDKPASAQKADTPAVKADAHDGALPARTGLVEYPFPLREGRFAYLRLPADLKMADVRRLTAYLNTLPDDAELA